MYEKFRNKNLLIITPRYPPKEGFPNNVFVKDQVDKLRKYFKKVVVIATSPYIPKVLSYFMQPKRRHEAVMRNYSYDNVKVYYNRDFILPFNWHKRKWGDKAYIKSIKILNKIKFEPDIIHAHFTWPSGYAAVKLAKESKVPIVITAHGYDVYDLPFRSNEWFMKVKFVLDSADHIITVSKSNALIITEKLAIPKYKVSIIPNGFVSSLFTPMDKSYVRKKLGLPLDKEIILNVANLVPVKGHKYLILAIKKVTEIDEKIMLIIVGDGPLRKKLKKEIDKLKLKNHVKLVGAKPHEEIPLWINAADLFVLPSLSEGNPTVMFESLGTGLPFIGSAVGGVSEIVTSEDFGLLCPPADPECLAEKILVALKKEWDREKIREYAQQFTWENIAKKIMKVYHGGVR